MTTTVAKTKAGAARHSARKKVEAKVDGRTVAQTGELICGHKEELLELLLGGKYSPKAVKAVDIPKANGGVRRLGIPTVLDRWVQQAVHQKLGPLG